MLLLRMRDVTRQMVAFTHLVYLFFFYRSGDHRDLHSFPTPTLFRSFRGLRDARIIWRTLWWPGVLLFLAVALRSEEHTSELQSHSDLVCRLLLEKKKLIAQIMCMLFEQC